MYISSASGPLCPASSSTRSWRALLTKLILRHSSKVTLKNKSYYHGPLQRREEPIVITRIFVYTVTRDWGWAGPKKGTNMYIIKNEWPQAMIRVIRMERVVPHARPPSWLTGSAGPNLGKRFKLYRKYWTLLGNLGVDRRDVMPDCVLRVSSKWCSLARSLVRGRLAGVPYTRLPLLLLFNWHAKLWYVKW